MKLNEQMNTCFKNDIYNFLKKPMSNVQNNSTNELCTGIFFLLEDSKNKSLFFADEVRGTDGHCQIFN